jgi:hypothetical protein
VSERSLVARLVSWIRGDPPKSLRTASPEEDEREPVHLQPEEEAWLRALITEVAEGKRIHDIGSDEFWDNVQAMWTRGHERLASEWIEKFIASPQTPAEQLVALRAELVDMLDRRGEGERAVPHLEALTAVPERALRAHYLLAEHYRRRGDEVPALRHYEAVLARDMDYPNVRARVERLRRARGQLAPAAVGETVAGVGVVGVAEGARYQLLRELGRGATGVVYMARDFELERDVAVKLLHPHLAAADRAAACARFFEEARLAASLRHPNIVAVLDLDERARRIVMELAAGGTLRRVLKDRGPRPVRRALERHAQILSALAAAHLRGVVHRDLKPGNLMFRRDPDEPGAEVVLGDFGVAHLPNEAGETGAAAHDDSKPEAAIGTLAYMSPEQRAGQWTDARTDLYAAAVVLYEMLTGRAPWRREVLLAGTRRPDDFRLPAEVRAEIPDDLREPLQQHLDTLGDPDRGGRPRTQEALREARSLRDLAIAEASQ